MRQLEQRALVYLRRRLAEIRALGAPFLGVRQHEQLVEQCFKGRRELRLRRATRCNDDALLEPAVGDDAVAAGTQALEDRRAFAIRLRTQDGERRIGRDAAHGEVADRRVIECDGHAAQLPFFPHLLVTPDDGETQVFEQGARVLRALHLDLDQSTVMPDGTRLLPDRGVRALPNIEAGGLGCALVAKDLLEYREDGRCAEDLPALERSCHTSMFAQADLFHGKAGQLAALARLGGTERDLRSRTLELEWYALPFRGHTAFPSGRMPRISMDLATGGAGVLLALSTAAGGGGPFLPFFAEPPGTDGGGKGSGTLKG